jgi:hypothetical protein
MEIYTIREIIKSASGSTGYLLEEVFGGILPNGKEVSFNPNRFVKVEEIDTLEELNREIAKLKELIDAEIFA